jgi:hypothetical protein
VLWEVPYGGMLGRAYALAGRGPEAVAMLETTLDRARNTRAYGPRWMSWLGGATCTPVGSRMRGGSRPRRSHSREPGTLEATRPRPC